MIDLRSDTVTLPTAAMMQAIARAELGDDVYGEDPTVNRLEARVAELLGKDAALFVPSGTMGNLCALLAHGQRGTRVVVGSETHIYRYEAGGASVVGGLVLHPVDNTADGGLDPAQLAEALESPDDSHVAPAGMLALENTHNRCGGTVLDAARIGAYAHAAHAHGLPLHIDGARLFNASVALGTTARSLVAAADSVQICFSKGLAAPAGSMVVGGAAFVQRARRARKMLGGGMRQAGILAAACHVALDTMIERLQDDHVRARRLAAAIGDALDPRAYALVPPASNIVLLRAVGEGVSVEPLVPALAAEGVRVSTFDAQRLRAVLHAGIDDAAVDHAIGAFRRVLGAR
jgi:threonine aldolase